MSQPAVILYTRSGCHLCEVACSILERHGLTPQVVDIDADSALRARYTNDVPVVEIDGIERFRGRVDELLLRRLLAGRIEKPVFGSAASRLRASAARRGVGGPLQLPAERSATS